jgi:hypothetical protein
LCKVRGIKHDAVELHRSLAGCFERRDHALGPPALVFHGRKAAVAALKIA